MVISEINSRKNKSVSDILDTDEGKWVFSN